jgi:hypothetical protein
MKCGKRISVTAGTIFHKTKTPLLKWFWLIFRMATSKTGGSIAEMQTELGITNYKTIWMMAHKIRKAMADRDAQYKLAGLVELGESFFGPASGGKRGREQRIRDWSSLQFLFWTDEEGMKHPGVAHVLVVEDASAEAIESVLKRLSLPGEEIIKNVYLPVFRE